MPSMPLKKHSAANDVAVGHMAVVASGVAAMARMAPRGIPRTHDVTVDAGSRVVAYNIGVHAKQVGE
jgi:hypothetical protein